MDISPNSSRQRDVSSTDQSPRSPTSNESFGSPGAPGSLSPLTISTTPRTVPIKAGISEQLSMLRNKSLNSFSLSAIPISEAAPESPLDSKFTNSSDEKRLDTENDSKISHLPVSMSPSNPSTSGVLSALFKKKNGSNDSLNSSEHNNNSSDTSPQSPETSGRLSNLVKLGIRRLSRPGSGDAELGIPLPEKATTIATDSIEDEVLSNPLDKRNIPPVLIDPGIELLRITHKKKIKRLFKLNLDKNVLSWNNKASSFIEIDKIKNIRTGDDAKNYREEFKVSSDYKDLWITIIYYNTSKSNNIKALHVIAISKQDFDIFLRTMKNLLFFKRQLNRSISGTTDSELFTKLHWNNKVSENENLGFDGVLKLISKLHIHIHSDYIKGLFNMVDDKMKGHLTFEEFKQFVKLLRDRREFSDLLISLKTEEPGRMNYKEFESFLIDIQQEVVESRTSSEVFCKYAKEKEYMNLEDFGNFLVSSYTSPMKDIKEDFTKPLNEYFISSSHNTYLLGRQFKGKASVEGYIRALQRGCRCIEIDIWDSENGPIVTHGRTLTNSVDFRTVIEVVRKYAFITSPYPVILSLEIRCNLENQLKVANILHEVLQGLLVTESMFTNTLSLPSPAELKHKILVKVKKSDSSGVAGSNDNENSSMSYSSSFSETDLAPSKTNSSSSSITKILPRKKKTVKIAKELGDLAVYVVGIRFRNFSLPESKTFNHCFSFSDKTLNKMIKDELKLIAILKHNRKFLTRVYPSIYRFNSANFNPLLYWEMGTQLVATNWQVFDLGQQINEAMFNVGSNSGYILKPPSQRIERGIYKSQQLQTVLNFHDCYYLNIEIISAQQLPKPKDIKPEVFDSYVELEVYSGIAYDVSIETGDRQRGSFEIKERNINLSESSSDESHTSKNDIKLDAEDALSLDDLAVVFKTSVIPQNGFNPLWGQQCKMKFHTNDNKFVFLRLLIKCVGSEDTSLIGVYCCKLDYLKKGYRHVPVYDLQGEEYIFSTLFLKIDYGLI